MIVYKSRGGPRVLGSANEQGNFPEALADLTSFPGLGMIHSPSLEQGQTPYFTTHFLLWVLQVSDSCHPHTSAAEGLGLAHLKGKRHQVPQGAWQKGHYPGVLALVWTKLRGSNYRSTTDGAGHRFLLSVAWEMTGKDHRQMSASKGTLSLLGRKTPGRANHP